MIYFDKEVYACFNCGHKWILGSNRFITDKQHWAWLKEAIKEHFKIQKEKENE